MDTNKLIINTVYNFNQKAININTKIILGRTSCGMPMKPRNWVYRLATTGAEFGKDKRLKYHKYIRPYQVLGETVSGLEIDDRLENEDPATYDHLMQFAASNELVIIDGRQTEIIKRAG